MTNFMILSEETSMSQKNTELSISAKINAQKITLISYFMLTSKDIQTPVKREIECKFESTDLGIGEGLTYLSFTEAMLLQLHSTTRRF